MLAVLARIVAVIGVFVPYAPPPASGDPISVLLGDQAQRRNVARSAKQYGLDKPACVGGPFRFGPTGSARSVLGEPRLLDLSLQRPVTTAGRCAGSAPEPTHTAPHCLRGSRESSAGGRIRHFLFPCGIGLRPCFPRAWKSTRFFPTGIGDGSARSIPKLLARPRC